MNAERLKDCLNNCDDKLRQIVDTLNLYSSSLSLHNECINKIKEFEQIGNHLSSIATLIDAREDTRKLLEKLLSETNLSNDIFEYYGTEITFNNARLLWFQAYLATTWAICDSITSKISPFLCLESACKNLTSPPQLISHFIKENKSSSYYIGYFIKLNYGWFIGASYAIRNHFVHDGAFNYGKNFFKGTSLVDEFKISQDGWNFINQKIGGYNVNNDQHRLGLGFQWNYYQDDLLELLKTCNNEIDEALICLLNWSVGIANLQAQSLLARDLPPSTSL